MADTLPGSSDRQDAPESSPIQRREEIEEEGPFSFGFRLTVLEHRINTLSRMHNRAYYLASVAYVHIAHNAPLPLEVYLHPDIQMRELNANRIRHNGRNGYDAVSSQSSGEDDRGAAG